MDSQVRYEDELKPFARRSTELAIEEDCLLWVRESLYSLLVERKSGRKCIQVTLEHQRAILHVWWPKLDAELEYLTNSCRACQETENNPPLAFLHPWEYPNKPWQRVHADFIGPFQKQMLLALIDAHSKWPEVILMEKTISEQTMLKLRDIFAPAVYQRKHPAPNGAAENFVSVTEKALRASLKESISIQEAIIKFLDVYRCTLHTTTGRAPCELMYGRMLRSRLNILKPQVESKIRKAQQRYGGNRLSDLKPTQLLRKMRTLKTDKDISEKVLQTLWMDKLPEIMKNILVMSEEGLDKLAEMADKIQEMNPRLQVYESKNKDPTFEEITATIASLKEEIATLKLENRTRQNRRSNSPRPRQRSRSRSDPTAQWTNACRKSRLFVTDAKTGMRFLIDSGADVSHIPFQGNGTPTEDIQLYASNGSLIPTYGFQILEVDLGLRKKFKWRFITARVSKGILGADFLKGHNLLIYLKNGQLIDGCTNLKIRGAVTSMSCGISTLDKNSKFYNILSSFPNITIPNLLTPKVQHNVRHFIATNGPPVFARARPLNSMLLKIAKKEFQYMLDNHIIRPSRSPWASPLHMVRKKEGSLRPCGDFRKLNSVTIPDRYPIPKLEDFNHILKNTIERKTAVITPFGLFEFEVMSFGLCGAPATFQRFINEVLWGLDFVFPYLDYILVASKSEEEHKSHLRAVFSRLDQYRPRINQAKTVLNVNNIEFLGYWITPEGIRPTESKVQARVDYKKPETVQDLRRFLGMLNFYRRFLKNAAEDQAILNDFLKGSKKNNKRPIPWTEEAEQKFIKCETELSKAALLSFPDPERPLALFTDASDRAMGAVLQHFIDGAWKPIAFFSKKLSESQTKYSTYDRELLAIFSAIKHFKFFLEGRDFTIFTDQKPLIYAFQQNLEKASPPREQEIGELPNNDHGPTTPPPHLGTIILQLATILERLQPLHPRDLDLTAFDELNPSTKLQKLPKYLVKQPLDLFRILRLDTKPYEEAQRTLKDLFPDKTDTTYAKIFATKSQHYNSLEEYFRTKATLGIQLNLPRPVIIEALTEGLPSGDQRLVRVVPPKSLSEWYELTSRLTDARTELSYPNFPTQFNLLLHNYQHIFSENKFDVPTLNIPPVEINTISDKIIILRPYRVPYCDLKEIQNQVAEMLKHNIIEKSYSPFASPVTLVTKRDKTKRFYIDFRKLNDIIQPDIHSLPLIDSVLDKLSRAKVFSSADIASAYWQVEIAPESRPLLAFVTPDGQYQWTRLPFGLKNSPQIYERAISQIIQKHNLQCIEHYFDEFIIFSDSTEEHIQHLTKFFEVCQAENIRLNYKKCEFFKTSIRRKFRIYLTGTKFTIFSDHHALQWLKSIKNPAGRLFRWSLRLSAYDYESRYIKGTQQYEADLLSRNPFCGFLDADAIQIHLHITQDTNGLHTITRKGVTKILIPEKLRSSLLNKVHLEYNHPGISQMSRLISGQYNWSGMSRDIKNHVNSCTTCQLTKHPKGPTYGELGQTFSATKPFDLLSIDTVSGFAKYGNSKTHLHVIVDHMTRYAWVFPSKSTSTLTYIQAIKKVLVYGSPKRLLSDRATSFTSEKFRRFLIAHGIQPLNTTSNNPQANGLCERLNSTITGKLRLQHLENPKTSWTKLVTKVTQVYNNTPHSVTGFPPSYLLFGIIPTELSNHINPYPPIDIARQQASLFEM
ncbi:hypothetical protein LAZ67_22000691 [Cordylochernes scorpioides]|uniref:RNA-directed DNA polymerase n=1 Tax=Cordylochernes scorpioides TaxID=51811 RepID=A0ABY6LNT3_9ARAC|nr:hypothetical protein LAZ67_22000691 [Cordylochernes scorpioides]